MLRTKSIIKILSIKISRIGINEATKIIKYAYRKLEMNVPTEIDYKAPDGGYHKQRRIRMDNT